MKSCSTRDIARLTIAAVVVLAGCTTIRRLQAQDTERLLAAAGFRIERMDTAGGLPGDAAEPYRLVSRTRNGAVEYTYADPANCRCVYLGGYKEYAEYERLSRERRMADERSRQAESIWDRDDWGVDLSR